MVEFARIWRDMPKIVYSRTLERADWNTTVVRDVVAEEVRDSRHSPAETSPSAGPTSPQPSCDTT
jgi:hypothetical protein